MKLLRLQVTLKLLRECTEDLEDIIPFTRQSAEIDTRERQDSYISKLYCVCAANCSVSVLFTETIKIVCRSGMIIHSPTFCKSSPSHPTTKQPQPRVLRSMTPSTTTEQPRSSRLLLSA